MIELLLEAGESRLLVQTESNGWSRCHLLLVDQSIYLGANSAKFIQQGLLQAVLETRTEVQPAGPSYHCGEPVVTALVLLEKHHILVVADRSPSKALFWRTDQSADSGLSLVHTTLVTSLECERWRDQLEAMGQDLMDAKIEVLP